MADKDLRINEQIRVREVRLVDDQGEQKGIVPTLEAIKMARDLGLGPRRSRASIGTAGMQAAELRQIQVRAGKEDQGIAGRRSAWAS